MKRSMTTKRWLVLILGILVPLGVLIWTFPGLRYAYHKSGPSLIRVDRLTGRAWQTDQYGNQWTPIHEPAEQLAKRLRQQRSERRVRNAEEQLAKELGLGYNAITEQDIDKWYGPGTTQKMRKARALLTKRGYSQSESRQVLKRLLDRLESQPEDARH